MNLVNKSPSKKRKADKIVTDNYAPKISNQEQTHVPFWTKIKMFLIMIIQVMSNLTIELKIRPTTLPIRQNNYQLNGIQLLLERQPGQGEKLGYPNAL